MAEGGLRSRLSSIWTPVVIVLLSMAGIAGALYYPDPDFADFMRIVVVYGVASWAIFAVFLWFLLGSFFSWQGKFLGLLSLAGVGALAYKTVEFKKFSGNLRPEFRFVWDKTQAELIRESRGTTDKVDAKSIAFTGRERTDFAQYRGENFDGVVQGAIAKDWKSKPPRMLWKQPCGGGYAQIAVAGDVAITIEQRDANEAIVCYDAVTGKERWVHEYPAYFKEFMGGEGPRATPTLRDGKVYSVGATGRLLCLDGATGKPIWDVDILEKSGSNIQWGVSCSPLLLDLPGAVGNETGARQLVVVNPGVNKNGTAGNGLVAYDRATGKKVWAAGDHYAGYSSARASTLCGQTVVLIFDGGGLAGHDANTGKELFRETWISQERINVAQPIVFDGDRVFITSGYGTGCAMLQVKREGERWSIAPLWKNKSMRCRFTSPVAREGFIYGLDEGILVCLDSKTGERKWKAGRYGNGQLLLVGDVLLIQAESGKIALVEANSKEWKELGQAPGVEGNTWNCPAIAHGKLYLRNHLEMACYDLAAP